MGSDLDEKLNTAIMETIWISPIDKSEQRRVHPKWFMANGQMFTFGIDTQRVVQVMKNAARLGNNFGDFIDENGKTHNVMTGQEWYDRFAKTLDDIELRLVIHNKTTTKEEILAAAKKAAGIE